MTTSNQEKINFRPTLNLPKTSFSMKANLSENEPKRLKEWDNQKLYQRILEKTQHAPLFLFHDGPPYANGNIHIGHLLNKVLKDFVVRSQNMFGKHCPYIPGWDCHGLPIEHKVMTELLAKKQDKLNQLEENKKRMIIRNECQKYASKFIQLQSKQMQRLLTLADYSNPYLTMKPKFESGVLDVFANLVKEDLVFRQLKPVHWSIENQTALAEAELEYFDRKDHSIYVGFEATDSQTIHSLFKSNQNGSILFLIWTTTPWTLPANLAIAVHERFQYSLVSCNNQTYIIASDRKAELERITGSIFNTLGTISGKELVNLKYQHPFCERSGRIVHADYVSLEDGSGLVHTAPGHGQDDYLTGLKENLDVYCPVTANGTYDDTVPEWLQGLSIWDANTIIIDHLKEKSLMLFNHEFMHSYPHDWRSKTPVIFRSTEQWFIGVDRNFKNDNKSLRDYALDSIQNSINFVPDWGKKRLYGMLEQRPDWCISRQRAWGLPIPAFKNLNGSIFLTHASVLAISKAFREWGSDAWFTKSAQELLTYYNPDQDPDKPADLHIESLEKLYDIFDVWFESGSSWNAVLNERNLGYPADLYLEGSDQHRGWFHLSLLTSVGSFKTAPYKSLLTHGFIVDKDGRKMSKSLGNTLNVDDLLKKYGAEVSRWWVSSLSYENDIKVDLKFFDIASEGYRKIRNTLRFLLSNLFDYSIKPIEESDISNLINEISPYSLNYYLLARLSQLISDVKEAYFNYRFKLVNQLLYDFCNDDLSSFYCMAIKDRLYCDKPSSPRRLESQLTMQITVHNLVCLLSPILPHTSEECFQALYNTQSKSVHLSDLINFDLTLSSDWDKLNETRSTVLKQLEEAKKNGIENSLDAGVQLPANDTILKFIDDLDDIFGVSRVDINETFDSIQIVDLRNEHRCERSWKRDQSVSLRDNGSYLSDRDFDAVN